jgi:hypothetical protein
MCYKEQYMIREYTHPELGREVRSISGYYLPIEEHVFAYNDREVIYVLGDACIEASCCGSKSWVYIQVPGFLVRRHIRVSHDILPISEVESIEGREDRHSIYQVLIKKYPGAEIEM